MTKPPRASVVMPVYNSEKYLKSAMDSILEQSFKNFDFIIIDDASTDNSLEIIKSYTDPRIKLVINNKNQGISYSLNRGINLSSGEYIIRMDSDDISLPKRFEKQIAFMDSHPKFGVCGTWVKTIGAEEGVVWRPSTKPDIVHCTTLFSAVLCHPSTIIRRTFLEQYSLRYCLEVSGFEDWDMWRRAAIHFPIVNIPQVLLYYRTRKYPKILNDSDFKAPLYDLFYELDRRNFKALNLQPTEAEVLIHRRLGSLLLKRDEDFVTSANKWLDKLYSANKVAKIYPEDTLHQLLAHYWLRLCNNSSSSPSESWNKFCNSPYLDIKNLNKVVKFKIFAKCFLRKFKPSLY